MEHQDCREKDALCAGSALRAALGLRAASSGVVVATNVYFKHWQQEIHGEPKSSCQRELDPMRPLFSFAVSSQSPTAPKAPHEHGQLLMSLRRYRFAAFPDLHH